MFRKLFTMALGAVLLAPSVARAADDVKLITTVFPPAIIDEGGGKYGGLFPDVIREVARRVGHSGTLEALPNARMHEIVKEEIDLLASMTRTPERDRLYQWIFQYGRDEMTLVTPKGKRFKTLADAPKNMEIGVLIGSGMAMLAQKNGFTNLSAVKSEQSNAEKLAAGRLDGWIAYRGVARYLFSMQGIDPGNFEYSEPAMVMDYYFGANLATPIAVTEKWRAAFESMIKDGTYAKIHAKYADWIRPAPTK